MQELAMGIVHERHSGRALAGQAYRLASGLSHLSMALLRQVS
jgi:hypothetical protein